jgi:hypothetical protein
MLSFLKENENCCTVVMKVENITPKWLPNFFDLISDTFLIGLKGQKDVLKYLTMKGYASDKYGIPWNLWAVRIHEHCSQIH